MVTVQCTILCYVASIVTFDIFLLGFFINNTNDSSTIIRTGPPSVKQI